MRNRRFMEPRVSAIAFAFVVFLSFFPGSILSAVVTLKSVKLNAATHRLIEEKPRVFFQCTGENKIHLPVVEEAGVLYSFKGQESWQPLTELQTKKCKKCGIYADPLPSDHPICEWDLCSSNFTAADGHCTVSKDGGVMATFVCPECSSLSGGARRIMKSEKTDGEKSHILPVMITFVIGILVIVASISLYKWWQKRKRQRDQARFMRLFEEDDDLEDELGLREMF